MSPYFLDAVRYARKVGYNSVQAATNGIEFAKSLEFAQQAAEAGMRYAYLQFDGIGNAANAHRKVGNLFDVKLKAIENLHDAGVEIVPVVTIVNGINNEQVGRIIKFALDNPKRIGFLSFQPVSFTGRDEAVTDDRREAQRYTLSHLAHDVKNQTGLGEPSRDWFPISFMGTFSDWADLMHVDDPKNNWGQLSCGCHPNCGTGMAVMIDKETKEAVPVTAFLKGDQLAKDIQKVNDAARGKFLTIVGMALCLMKNYDPFQSPTHFKLMDLLKKFDKNFNATGKNYGKVGPDRTIDDVMKRRQDRWNFLFIAGMWFQDLFNYDFRRTEQCIIPYATQEGEISFCAYNTGVGWRNIIEKMHMTATLTKWYEEHGRHEIFAGGKNVKMESTAHSLLLKDELVTNEEQHDLDKLGIAKNSGEEKKRARDAKQAAARGPQKDDAAYNARMAALYREVVLQEKPVVAENGFIPLGGFDCCRSLSRRLVSRFWGIKFLYTLNHRKAARVRRPFRFGPHSGKNEGSCETRAVCHGSCGKLLFHRTNIEPKRLKPESFRRTTVWLKAYPDTNRESLRRLPSSAENAEGWGTLILVWTCLYKAELTLTFRRCSLRAS